VATPLSLFSPSATGPRLTTPRSGLKRSDFVLQRNRHLQPKTAFLRLPPVHRADLKGQLRVDSGLSPQESHSPLQGKARVSAPAMASP
jgi:hypothetical protein